MMEDKQFYTTYDLIRDPDFPVSATITIKKLIERGELEAYDVSTSPKYKRYRIPKESVQKFLEKRRETGTNK